MVLENNSESIFDAIPDVIGIVDRDYRIIRLNTAGCEFFNVTYNEVGRKKWSELIGTQNHIDRCTITQCFERKESTQDDYYYVQKDVWGM